MMADQMTFLVDLGVSERRPWQGTRHRTRRQKCPRHTDGRGRHDHSLAGHDAVESALAQRRQAVLAYVAAHAPLTIRDVLRGMFPGSDNMDLVRPRVSELLTSRDLVEYDTVTDPETHRPVMRVAVPGGAS